MRKNIHKMLEPTLLGLFYQFRHGLKFPSEFLDKELDKFTDKKNFLFNPLTEDEYYYLLTRVYGYPYEVMQCLRCILKIQRDFLSDEYRQQGIKELKYWANELNKKGELFIEI